MIREPISTSEKMALAEIFDDKASVIKLTPAEIQSGHDRVKWAEGLIRQLPEDHDGRNSWLLNYGQKETSLKTENPSPPTTPPAAEPGAMPVAWVNSSSLTIFAGDRERYPLGGGGDMATARYMRSDHHDTPLYDHPAPSTAQGLSDADGNAGAVMERLLEERRDGTAAKDWEAWATEAAINMQRLAGATK